MEVGRPADDGATAVADRCVSVRIERATWGPGVTRQVVADTLERWGRTDVLDDVVLCASELATNAVVHGAPPAVLVLTDATPAIVVEVIDAAPLVDDFAWRARLDADPALPPSHRPGGRGLRIVDHLATAWGVAPRPTGKAVWCAVGGPTSGERDDRVGTDPAEGSAAVTGVPVRLLVAVERHLDGVVGALRLAALKGDRRAAGLADHAGLLAATFGRQRTVALAAALAAARRGDEHVDVEVVVPPDAERVVPEVAALLDAAEAWAEDRGATALAPGEELVRFRRWFLAELLAVAAGRRRSTRPFSA